MVAESMGATPIPKSHFTSFREDVNIEKKGELQRDGKVVANGSDLKTIIKPLDHLSNARFNCSAFAMHHNQIVKLFQKKITSKQSLEVVI